ncbi:MAG: hypothetical protein BWX56_01577 [Euryarchaeota archaeon ADurb.Bin023]|jgi:hypothetical protein|nr:MAG: hypothetical protein BWX56_01577 [Euryarchaeota archaeon ADurb.Bin023]HQM18241.1 hypothetical protein [Bacilli bacterium]
MDIEEIEALDDIEEVKELLKNQLNSNEDNSSVIETQNKRISELEEQLNITNKTFEETQAKLKEMENKKNELNPEEVTPEVTTEEVPEEVPEEAPKEEPKKEEQSIENMSVSEIKELNERLTRIENERLLDKLNEELREASKLYPNMVKEKILFELANGTAKSVKELAKESHESESERIKKLEEKILKEKEAEIEERVRKELAGGNVLPQSPGSPSVAPSEKKLSYNEAWEEAVRRAKQEGN